MPKEADGRPDHLQDIDDSVGCTEIWEHLSDERENDNTDESEN
jgi:hypothetical protein